MKTLFTTLLLIPLTIFCAHAQIGHTISGTIIDSTKLSVPGAIISLNTDQGDSSKTAADLNGKFTFQAVKGTKITLSITSIGYQSLRKHYVLDNDAKPVTLGNIVLSIESNLLKQVTINGGSPITFKEDTTEYRVSSFKVRENAPIEDVIKKLPGVDVDVNGNITTQGKQVTKVRINGKDFMGGDVQSATKNLPADIVENIQMIDDYGDQANLTGVKTGEPEKIMNITIRKDKNYGYTLQGTGGDGEDLLPKSQGIPNQNRYLGTINSFTFNGDQQTSLLGSINNTNVNTFSFNSSGSGGGFGGGGGGGRGNAARGMQNNGSLITAQNGITDAHSIGANFRDQWSKSLSVYGSYSFADNTVTTNSNVIQQNNSPVNSSINNQSSTETNRNMNHRFAWNMEYKPDTINYLKVTPTFSYAGTNTNDAETANLIYNRGGANSAYTLNATGTSSVPAYGASALYNHRFKHRRNLSINASFNSSVSNQYQNPIYNYTEGKPLAPTNQEIYTYSRTNTIATNFSYLEPVGKYAYLEFNYALSRSVTSNDKTANVLDTTGTSTHPYMTTLVTDSALSNRYNYTFITNRFGLNYRFIKPKYNYTLGITAQPAVLDGSSPITNIQTHVSTFEIIPTARFVYNFSRSNSFSLNYNGSSSQPAFNQLQPVTDFSNAQYPVRGNPNLKPQFTNNLSARYNKFNFQTGDAIFTYVSYQQIQNQVITNTISYPKIYTPDPRLQNTILTTYTNANGYYTINGGLVYSKPFDSRKYTLSLGANINYSNNIGYLTSVDLGTYAENTVKNISKNLQLNPNLKFRVDLTNIIDAQFVTNYAINRTNNSVQNNFTNGSSSVRTWNIGINGKNYLFTDWTFSYDYSKAINYGYAQSLNVTNPNILNLYLERRFLKQNRATIRIAAYDLFNQNTGFTDVTTPSSTTQAHVNRLSRYFLATFTLRLQKFAGKAPAEDPATRGFRRDGGTGGGGPGGPGF